MTTSFRLDAFETFLRAVDATGALLDAEVTVTRRGAVVLHLTRSIGDATIEVARFHVRGHAATEVSVHDPRFKPTAARSAKRIRDDAPATR